MHWYCAGNIRYLCDIIINWIIFVFIKWDIYGKKTSQGRYSFHVHKTMVGDMKNLRKLKILP